MRSLVVQRVAIPSMASAFKSGALGRQLEPYVLVSPVITN
jgi:hypothetical protein